VITSEPEGAVVWVNDVEVGRTPLETSFTFYGTYDVRVRLEGYEPVSTHRLAATPWYEYAPIDFFAQAIPPGIETRIGWHFELEPLAERALAEPEAEAALLGRAGELRAATRGEASVPPGDGGDAGDGGAVGDVAGDDGAGADDAPVPDGEAGEDA
jgi:hypothetical protein